MVLEVIATDLKDFKQAEDYGADRIELCSSISEQGITPSYGLIQTALAAVDIPINIMVRPHNHSFVYSDDDLEIMLTDIRAIKHLGANSIVVGSLTKKGTVDETSLEKLLTVADGLDVTFHRAFDFARDQMEALTILKKYEQVTTILTAGGKNKAPEAIDMIQKLSKKTESSHLQLMIGHGLHSETFHSFYQQVQPRAVHFGSGVRMGNSFSNSLDREKIKTVKNVLIS